MKELIIKAKQGDKNALEEILNKFQPLVNKTIASFYIYGCDFEDIRQIAILGIINAVNKFDINLSASFPSYVKECVRNSMYKEIEKATKHYYKNKLSKEIAEFIDIKEIIDEKIDNIKKMNKKNLEKAISLLKEEDRNLLKVLYVENKTLKPYSKDNNIEYHKARYKKDKVIKNLKETLLNN